MSDLQQIGERVSEAEIIATSVSTLYVSHVDRQSAAELFADCVGGITPQHIRISSLATIPDPCTRLPTKTATLSLQGSVPAIGVSPTGGEWVFHYPGLAKPLILDQHFQGLTPLNEVNPINHEADCIVLSGLASHPFGSWQPHGGSKSFMWIRDELPQYLPTVRFIIYGYDTVLYPSNSFQTIPDLANSFINILKAEGWASPMAKPLMFLAHSLGGVLLKQVLLMLAGSGQTEKFIANLVRGAIFFGVPSCGMAIEDISIMLEDQPNKEALVAEISKDSKYLPQLEKQFSGISLVRTMKLFWAYETKTTLRLEKTKGNKYNRSGRDIMLVTKESATGGRCLEQPSMTIQIDENHSDMVKFFAGHNQIRVMASKLSEICCVGQTTPTPEVEVQSDTYQGKDSQQSGPDVTTIDDYTLIPDPLTWNDEGILNSLRAPERDIRMEQIDPHSTHTFHWVFDKPSVGLAKWLRSGQGIFWISGKPGSGKSTLMKFIHRDPRTSELLHTHKWKSGSKQITASFFFHYRGSVIQKSFEGLLRGIISKILEAQPELLSIIKSAFSEMYNQRVASQRLGSLQTEIYRLFKHWKIQEDASLHREIQTIVESQDSLLSLQKSIRAASGVLGSDLESSANLETELIRRRDDFINEGIKPQARLFFEYKSWRYCKSENQLLSIIQSWLDALDLNHRLRLLLKSRGLEGIEEVISDQDDPYFAGIQGHQTKKTTIKFAEPVERDLKNLIKRHDARNHIRIKIQNEEWPRQKLEDILRQLCAQELFDLDLCLILDALDEYDGRPEFISGFLKDLVEKKFPRTKIRILFSSRPWGIFREEFKTCPSFEIHQYTQDDIRNYCIASVRKFSKTSQFLTPLIEDIVTRSSGVFLWVKLVLHDLFKLISDHKHGVDDIQDQLRKTLDSLPDKLDEYYASIIERVSQASRWETYVLLESLARSDRLLKIQDLAGILKSSRMKICPNFKRQQNPLKDSEITKEHISEISGGLVDVGPLHVELMHQTVRDFVEAPQFRCMVLGDEHAEFTKENGHSFLSKYLFLSSDYNLGGRLSFHAREAERTTGLSQCDFFSSAQPEYFNGKNKKDATGSNDSPISSPLTLAAFAGLQIFLEDTHKANNKCVKKSSDPILSSLFDGMHHGLCPVDAIKTAKSLLSKGLVVEGDKIGVAKIVSRIWLSSKTGTWRDYPDEDYISLATLLVDHLKDLNLSIGWRSRMDESAMVDVTGSILHLSPPTIAERLLSRKHGANPNALDSTGCSPLDYILLDESAHTRSAAYLHQAALLLVNHGGKLNTTTREEWDAFIQHLQCHNLGTEAFAKLRFPIWCRGHPRSRRTIQGSRGSSFRSNQ